MDDGAPPIGTLAERLEWLFDKIRPTVEELADPAEVGRMYQNKEIAEKINHAREAGLDDTTITGAYVGEIRRGKTTDPRVSHLRALAWAFGVDPAFFIDDNAAVQVRREIDLLLQLRTMEVRQVALRQVLADRGLSETGTDLVEQLVQHLTAAQLPPDDPSRPR